MERKEAVKIVRNIYQTDAEKEALETLIPELCESEDERMRKAALKGIEYLERILGWDFIGDIDILDVKEYLEKQKEPLRIPETCKENADSFTSEDERIRKDLIKDFRNYYERYDKSWGEQKWGSNRLAVKDILAWLEKQKEQKPSTPEDISAAYQMGLAKGRNEQKPAGWSEEDEKHRQWILECLADGKRKVPEFAEQYQAAFDWLKSLRPHWKPSEQEKGALRTAIHILTDERSFPKAAGHLQAILDAFEGKESRKDWKPSEDQMNRLSSLRRTRAMSKRAETAAINAYPVQGMWVGNQYGDWDEDTNRVYRNVFLDGYEQAEEDIISLIESRIGEILGDAQPAPVLRAELRELVNKIEEK